MMTEARRCGVFPQLDIQQILSEAQHRWLRPAEVCEILKNHKRFRIAPEPPNRPPSGSLFLFDRKILRYFRKDGHNWRKKKDGKTIKEAHERLKSGSVEVLHCYYAHGQDNETFQRRSYWMLEEDFMHIVLVHYLEVQGGKSSLHRTRQLELPTYCPINSSSYPSPSESMSRSHFPSEPESSITGQNSELEDAESVLPRPGYNAFPQMDMVYKDAHGQMTNHPCSNSLPFSNYSVGGTSMGPNTELYFNEKEFCGPSLGTLTTTQFDMSAFNDAANNSNISYSSTQPQLQMQNFGSSFSSPQGPSAGDDIESDNAILDGVFANELGLEDDPDALNGWQYLPDNFGLLEEDNMDEPGTVPPLEKGDSFSRWMSKELIGEVDVDSSQNKSNSDSLWNSVDVDGVMEDTGVSTHAQLETFAVGPMISEDQLFSILDYSPNWVYANSHTKVLVLGKFMKCEEEVKTCKWACMFGEIEVPCELLPDRTLQCYSPSHKPGRVPFYITVSNRLACSEIREFEFQEPDSQFLNISHLNPNSDYSYRLDQFLTLDPNSQQQQEDYDVTQNIIMGLMSEDDELSSLFKSTEGETTFSGDNEKDELVKKLIKEKLQAWLLVKVKEKGKGPCVLDKEGQGVIHLAAALGYYWAVRPTIAAGVSVNFRDAHGWTALHWAAFCGRERTVGALITLGADPGALTDPTPEFPAGRTPADLASSNGHKGISGFLAESSLTSLLDILTLKDSNDKSSSIAANLAPPRISLVKRVDFHISSDDGSWKDSLSAVRNASEAAAKIFQVFRMQSFQRKKVEEEFEGEGSLGISDKVALAKAIKAPPVPYSNPYHEAAVRIQNKFRGYKGRKEFLLIKRRIVRLQAHVRGHQVRKHYKKIIWSVGIVEKIILRWRRKGSGLRGFKSEAPPVPVTGVQEPVKEDEDDFLKVGRRQTEARLEKALARVKSMVQYPEARDQYRRLLTTINQLQESQARILKEAEEAEEGDDFMVEFKELWEDDISISMLDFN